MDKDEHALENTREERLACAEKIMEVFCACFALSVNETLAGRRKGTSNDDDDDIMHIERDSISLAYFDDENMGTWSPDVKQMMEQPINEHFLNEHKEYKILVVETMIARIGSNVIGRAILPFPSPSYLNKKEYTYLFAFFHFVDVARHFRSPRGLLALLGTSL